MMPTPSTVLRYGGLFGKLMVEKVFCQTYVAVEQPAYHAQGKHIAAFQNALVVHASIFQTVLYHSSYRAGHYAVGVNTHFV